MNLVGALVATGIVVGTAAVISDITTNASRSVARTRAAESSSTLRTELTLLFARPGACAQSLKRKVVTEKDGKLFTEFRPIQFNPEDSSTDLTDVQIPGLGQSLLSLNEQKSGHRVSSIGFAPVAPPVLSDGAYLALVRLQIELQPLPSVGGLGRKIEIPMQITTVTDKGFQAVIDCKGDLSGAAPNVSPVLLKHRHVIADGGTDMKVADTLFDSPIEFRALGSNLLFTVSGVLTPPKDGQCTLGLRLERIDVDQGERIYTTINPMGSLNGETIAEMGCTGEFNCSTGYSYTGHASLVPGVNYRMGIFFTGETHLNKDGSPWPINPRCEVKSNHLVRIELR